NGVRLKSQEKKVEAPSAPAKAASDEYTVTVNNQPYAVQLKGSQAIVNGVAYDIDVKEGIDAVVEAPSTTQSAAPVEPVTVKAPMPGLILRIDVKVGDTVKQNQGIAVMEAMKMENEIFAPEAGTITE